jgi:PPOX class probable F420-dependent enzyme
LDALTRQLFEGANVAHVATVMPDGSPQSAPVWIDLRDDRLLFCRQEEAIGYRNLKRDPRVAISITEAGHSVRCAYVRGRVAAFVAEPQALQFLDEISIKYTGTTYPRPAPPGMVALFVEVERARSDDFTRSNGH